MQRTLASIFNKAGSENAGARAGDEEMKEREREGDRQQGEGWIWRATEGRRKQVGCIDFFGILAAALIRLEKAQICRRRLGTPPPPPPPAE